MASLEVRWSGEPRAEIAAALQGLGLEEVDRGRYLAEGDGRSLVRVVGAVRDLDTRVRSAGGELSVRFVDSASAASGSVDVATAPLGAQKGPLVAPDSPTR